MRKIFSLACTVLLALTAGARAETGTLTVLCQGLDSDAGTVRLALFDSAAGYNARETKRAMARGVVARIRNGQASIVLDNLPYGTYAFKLFHDANGNGKLDTNLFGIPVEQYAFSNNAKARFGIPQFSDAAFNFETNTTVTMEFQN